MQSGLHSVRRFRIYSSDGSSGFESIDGGCLSFYYEMIDASLKRKILSLLSGDRLRRKSRYFDCGTCDLITSATYQFRSEVTVFNPILSECLSLFILSVQVLRLLEETISVVLNRISPNSLMGCLLNSIDDGS